MSCCCVPIHSALKSLHCVKMATLKLELEEIQRTLQMHMCRWSQVTVVMEAVPASKMSPVYFTSAPWWSYLVIMKESLPLYYILYKDAYLLQLCIKGIFHWRAHALIVFLIPCHCYKWNLKACTPEKDCCIDSIIKKRIMFLTGFKWTVLRPEGVILKIQL